MTTLINIIQTFENPQFFNTGGNIFYYEPSTGTLNFGYGFNINAQGVGALQGIGLPPQAISLLNSYVPGVSSGQEFASQLNSLVSGLDFRSQATTLTNNVLQSLSDYFSGPGSPFSNFSSLPAGVQDGILNVAYNAGPGTSIFGPNFRFYINSGDYGDAAYELAFNTYGSSASTGSENRILSAAAELLGFDVLLNPSNNVILFSGSADSTAVNQFLGATVSQTGLGAGFSAQTNGFALIDQAVQFQTQNQGAMLISDSYSIGANGVGYTTVTDDMTGSQSINYNNGLSVIDVNGNMTNPIILNNQLSTINLGGSAGLTDITNNGSGNYIYGDNGSQLTLSGSLANINLGSQADINYYAAGGTITTGGGSQVGIFNDGVTTINLGLGCTDGIHCNGVSVSGSQETVNVDNGSGVTVTGGANTVTSAGDASITINGDGNTLTDNPGATGDTVTITGNSDAAYVTDAVSVAVSADDYGNLFGDGNTITLSAGDAFGAYGGANTVDAVAGSLAYLSGTDTVFDQVYVNGDQSNSTAADGQQTGIVLDDDTQVNLFGSTDSVLLGTGDSLGAYGGGNTLTAGAGNCVVVGDTDSDFDAVYANGDLAGGTTANGQGTAVELNEDAQANLFGGTNSVYLATGDTLGAYGGGNTLSTGADDLLVVGDTEGDFDAIYAANDQSGAVNPDGQGTGIYLNDDTEVNLYGSGNTVELGTDDTLGAYDGGGNVIFAGAGDYVAVSGTGSNIDAIQATGDQSGGTTDDGQVGTGIYLSDDAEANVSGGDDYLILASGAYLGLIGDSGYNVTGTSASIATTADTDFALSGSGNAVALAGGDSVSDSGSGDRISLTGDNYLALTGSLGATVSNDVAGDTVNLTTGTSATIDGSGGYFGIIGTDIAAAASDENIQTAADASFSLTGNGDQVTLGSDSYVALSGVGSAVGNDVAGSTVDLANGSSATVYGSGGDIGVFGSDTLTASNETVNFGAGQTDIVNLAGGSDAVHLLSGDYLGLLGGDGYTVTGTGGDIATWADTGLYLSGSGNTLSLAAGDVMNDAGGGDTFTLSGGDYVGLLGGAGYTLTDEGTGSEIATWANTTFYVNGSDETIDGATGDVMGVTGNNDSVTESGGTVALVGAGDTGTVYGSSLYLSGGSSANLVADYDATSSTGATLDLNGNGNALYTYAGAVTINGSGDTGLADGNALTLANGSDANLVANYDQVSLGTGVDFVADGGGNAITAGATDLLQLSGTNGAFDAITATGDAAGGTTANGQGTGIYLNLSTQANVTGAGDTIVLSTGDSLGAYGGGNTIEVGGDDTVYISGTGGDADGIGGNGDVTGGVSANGQPTGITLANGAQATLDGTDDVITLDGNDALTIGGSVTDTIYASNETIYGNAGDRIIIYGDSDYVYANLSNIVVYGSNDDSIGRDDVLYPDGGYTDDYAFGDSDSDVDDSGGGTDSSGDFEGDGDSSYGDEPEDLAVSRAGPGALQPLAAIPSSPATVNANGGSTITYTNPTATVSSSVYAYSGENGSGVFEGELDDLADGTSVFFEEPATGTISETISVYSAPDAGGTLTVQTENHTDGTSLQHVFAPTADLAEVTFGFAGANATGAVTSVLLDNASGSSVQASFGTAATIPSAFDMYDGPDATGALEWSVANTASGNSTLTQYDSSGNSLAVYAFSAASGEGQLLQVTYPGAAGSPASGQTTLLSVASGTAAPDAAVTALQATAATALQQIIQAIAGFSEANEPPAALALTSALPSNPTPQLAAHT